MNITIGSKTADPVYFESEPDEKILLAALRNKLIVPYECATGTCGSCRAKLISGDLDQGWVDAPGRKALKTARGEFLMCQAVAQSDCEIRIPSSVSTQTTGEPAPGHFAGTVANIVQLTDEVRSFSVFLDEAIGFQSGQFMILQLPGVVGARAYSMVNYALQTDKLEFVIKRLEGGKCSEQLFDKPPERSKVTLFGPLGHAVFEPEHGHDLLLLAGDSGIAGMMAMLEQADQIGYLQSHHVNLIFGVRSLADIFYQATLQRLAERHPEKLQITIALSEQTADVELNKTGDVQIRQGFVHELIGDAKTDANTMAFVAGPPPMVDASIRELLGSKGFAVDKIRYDKFA